MQQPEVSGKLAKELAQAVVDGHDLEALPLVNRLADYVETADERRVLADTHHEIIERLRQRAPTGRPQGGDG